MQGGAIMAKCRICGKGAHFGHNVSHSNRKTNAVWKANVKSVRVKVNGAAKKNVRLYFLFKKRVSRACIGNKMPLCSTKTRKQHRLPCFFIKPTCKA